MLVPVKEDSREKKMETRLGTNLDRRSRSSFARALPRFTLPPSSGYFTACTVEGDGSVSWDELKPHEGPCSRRFRPRKSVCAGPLLSPSVHVGLSLSLSYTATHGKWQPYCTRATLANQHTHHYRENVRKSRVNGSPRPRASLRLDAARNRGRDAAENTRITRGFTNQLRKNHRESKEPLFTTRLRVQSAVDARVSLVSLLDGRYAPRSNARC